MGRSGKVWRLAVVLAMFGSLSVYATTKKYNSPPPRSAPARSAARPAGTNRGNTANRGTAYRGPRAGAPTTSNRGVRLGGAPGRTDWRPAPNRPVGIGNRPLLRGGHVNTLRTGSAIQRRADGRVSDIHDARRGMYIHHGLNGRRSISVMRADRSRVFAERGRPGFVERPYQFHGHDFARRTYYYRGRAYSRFYRGYRYHDVDVEVYAPGVFYRPGFYGWVYNPWGAPVVYTWGWGGSPWVSYYGYYFTPYPVYPSAPYWLTDYMISQDLQADYQAAQDTGSQQAAAAQGGQPELTPAVKQAIAAEVQYQIALENSEAQQTAQGQDTDPGSSGIARLLQDGHEHVFVAGSDLDVVDAAGNECAVSPGDVLELTSTPPPDAQAADLVVLASKGTPECARADTVTVAYGDLQEMQNHMRATIDQGLQTLQAQQGSNGLPAAPASAQAAPVATQYAQLAPPPDPNGADEVNEQAQQADGAEQEVTAEAAQEAAPSGSSATVAPPPPPQR